MEIITIISAWKPFVSYKLWDFRKVWGSLGKKDPQQGEREAIPVLVCAIHIRKWSEQHWTQIAKLHRNGKDCSQCSMTLERTEWSEGNTCNIDFFELNFKWAPSSSLYQELALTFWACKTFPSSWHALPHGLTPPPKEVKVSLSKPSPLISLGVCCSHGISGLACWRQSLRGPDEG